MRKKKTLLLIFLLSILVLMISKVNVKALDVSSLSNGNTIYIEPESGWATTTLNQKDMLCAEHDVPAGGNYLVDGPYTVSSSYREGGGSDGEYDFENNKKSTVLARMLYDIYNAGEETDYTSSPQQRSFWAFLYDTSNNYNYTEHIQNILKKGNTDELIDQDDYSKYEYKYNENGSDNYYKNACEYTKSYQGSLYIDVSASYDEDSDRLTIEVNGQSFSEFNLHINDVQYGGSYATTANHSKGKINTVTITINSASDYIQDDEIEVKVYAKQTYYTAEYYVLKNASKQRLVAISNVYATYDSRSDDATIKFEVDPPDIPVIPDDPTPSVSLKKYITQVWSAETGEYTYYNEVRKNSSTKSSKPVKIGNGDIVYYTVEITNNTDNPINVTFLDEWDNIEGVSIDKSFGSTFTTGDISRDDNYGYEFINLELPANETQYFYLELTFEGYTSVVKNTAQVTYNGKTLKDYDYVELPEKPEIPTIKKYITKVTQPDGSFTTYDDRSNMDMNSKYENPVKLIKKGSIVEYTIEVTNTTSSKLLNYMVVDTWDGDCASLEGYIADGLTILSTGGSHIIFNELTLDTGQSKKLTVFLKYAGITDGRKVTNKAVLRDNNNESIVGDEDYVQLPEVSLNVSLEKYIVAVNNDIGYDRDNGNANTNNIKQITANRSR